VFLDLDFFSMVLTLCLFMVLDCPNKAAIGPSTQVWEQFVTVPNLYEFTRWLTGAIDFHSRKKILWQSTATVSCLDTNILQNIFFCVQQKKETHTGLEQHEGE